MTGESDDPAPTKPHVRWRLQGMDPDEFEYFVADVWERLNICTIRIDGPAGGLIDRQHGTGDRGSGSD